MRETNIDEELETEEVPSDSRRPTHVAYWVKDRENKRAEWKQIGVAWCHADGKGFNLALDLQPRDGRVTLRQIEPKTGERDQADPD
jgi:hypothetical protein